MARQIQFNGFLIKQYGSYIRTDLSLLREINGFGSNVIGVLGLAERGEVDKPVEIDGYAQLVETFGDGPLVRHGLAMYIGGASRLVCVRIGNARAATLSATVIEPQLGTAGTTKTYSFKAREKGTFGNNISISVSALDVYSNNNIVELPASQRQNDDLYNVRIRYADRRGNDYLENFYFPRFIPLATIGTRNRFYPASSKYYYLFNVESQTLQEVPAVWASGAADEEAFLFKVEQKKSTSDVLLELPIYNQDSLGNPVRNLFPLGIIASVINFGGLDYAPSQFMTVEDVDPSLEDIMDIGIYVATDAEVLLTHSPFYLSGGTNGDDGTGFYKIDGNPTFDTVEGEDIINDTWTKGLGLLETHDVNFVQPAYLFSPKANNKAGTTFARRYGFFKSIMPQFRAHVTTQSNTKNRNFRTSIVGLPYYKSKENLHKTNTQYLEDIQDASGIIDNDRFQLWVGGFRSRAFSNQVENYGGEMVASMIVGMQAARFVNESLTFLPVDGIFTDGLEFDWRSQDKDELYTRAHSFVMRYTTATGARQFTIASNTTSWTGSANTGILLFITRRIVDYMNRFVYKNLEQNFIGRISKGAETAGDISSFVSTLLKRLVQENVLTAFTGLKVNALPDDPTVYEVEYKFQPVTEIDFIPVTNYLTYSLT